MVRSLLKIPFSLLRDAVRSVTGGGAKPPPPPRPADQWEMRAAQGRTAAAPAPAPDDDRGHSHDHGHSHGHSHDHASDPAPAGPPVRVTAEGTPNPSAMKFTVNRTVREAGSLSLNSAAEAKGDALGAALFAVEGVRSIFAVNDFVTVTREAEADWSALAPAVEAALTQHFSA